MLKTQEIKKIEDYESSKLLPTPKESSSESSIPNNSPVIEVNEEEGINDQNLFPEYFHSYLQRKSLFFENLSEEEKLYHFAELLSRYSYEGKIDEMYEMYFKTFSHIKNQVMKYKGVLAFLLYVRLAIFCAFINENKEGLFWCEKAMKIKKEFSEKEKEGEEVKRNSIRLFNVYGDLLVRGSVIKDELRQKASNYLEKGKKLINEYDPGNDEQKMKWKEQSRAWNLMNEGQVRFKLEPDVKLHEELFNKALRMFREGGNARLINTCVERMKKNAIEIKNEDNHEEMVVDQSQIENWLKQSNIKEALKQIIQDIGNRDEGKEETSCKHLALEEGPQGYLIKKDYSMNGSDTPSGQFLH